MISKEVLAKVNKIIAVAVTKHMVRVEIKHLATTHFMEIGQTQEDCTTIYWGGDLNSNWIYLEEPNALDKLELALRWLHTLENRDD